MPGGGSMLKGFLAVFAVLAVLAIPPSSLAAGTFSEQYQKTSLPQGWSIGHHFFSEMRKHNAAMYTNAALEVSVGYTELYSLEYGAVENAVNEAIGLYTCKKGKKAWTAEVLSCANNFTLYFFERNGRVVMLTSDFSNPQQEKEVKNFIGAMYFSEAGSSGGASGSGSKKSSR